MESKVQREAPYRRAAVSWGGALPSAGFQVWNQHSLGAVAIWGASQGDTLLGFCPARSLVRGKVDTESLSLTCTHSFNKHYQRAALGWGPEVETTGWNLGAKHPTQPCTGWERMWGPRENWQSVEAGKAAARGCWGPHGSLGGEGVLQPALRDQCGFDRGGRQSRRRAQRGQRPGAQPGTQRNKRCAHAAPL